MANKSFVNHGGTKIRRYGGTWGSDPGHWRDGSILGLPALGKRRQSVHQHGVDWPYHPCERTKLWRPCRGAPAALLRHMTVQLCNRDAPAAPRTHRRADLALGRRPRDFPTVPSASRGQGVSGDRPHQKFRCHCPGGSEVKRILACVQAERPRENDLILSKTNKIK